MKKILLFTLFILLFNSSFSYGQREYTPAEIDFGNWITYYYLNPEPEKITEGLKFYCKSKMFKDDPEAWPLAVFFAVVLKSNPEQLEQTYTKISKSWSKNEKILLLRTLWLIKSKKSKAYIEELSKDRSLKKILEEIEENRPPGIWLGPVESPLALDMLWAHFFATGKDRAIKRMLSALAYFKPGHGRFRTGAAAYWSLGANGYQHTRVNEIFIAELEKLEELEELKESQKYIQAMLLRLTKDIAGRIEKEGEFKYKEIKF